MQAAGKTRGGGRGEKEAEEEGERGHGGRREKEEGENGWRSACVSSSGPPVGLGSSAAVSVLVLRVLPDPGSRGKSMTHQHVLHRSPSLSLCDYLRNILRASVAAAGVSPPALCDAD